MSHHPDCDDGGDLYERLEELGYGSEDDLGHLHYALLSLLPPFNTDDGAAAVLGLASAVEAVVVVVDTLVDT